MRIRDKQTGAEFEGPDGTSFDATKYEVVGSAGEGGPKPGFFQTLAQAASETVQEIPGKAKAQAQGIANFFSDPLTPLRLSSGTVAGPVGPVLSSALNVGTEGLAQLKEGDLNLWNLGLAAGLPFGISAAARVPAAAKNFRTRVQPGRFRGAQEAAQADLETTLTGAKGQAPKVPADLPPPPTSLGQDVDMITRRLGNQQATETAYEAARTAIPGGSGQRVPMTNLQAAMQELETHVIPKTPGPGTLQPLADEVERLKAAQGSGAYGTEGTMPVGDAIKELRELGIRLKNRSDELGNLSKGHLAYLWKSLHADVEAAARAGVPGAAEALEAAKALKGQLAGESVERMTQGATKEGVVDPEALARALRKKADPLERLTDPETVTELGRTAERHRIESGVREGANTELAKQRAAQAKVTAETEQKLKGAFKNPQTGGSPQVGGENMSTLDVGALETLLNKNEAAAEKAFGPGGVQLLRDFIEKNRALPPKFEGVGGMSTFQGLMGTLAAMGGLSGTIGNKTAGFLGLGALVGPQANRAIQSANRAFRATPPPPLPTTPRPFGQAPTGLEQSQELRELLLRLSRGGTGALTTGLSNALRQ